MHGQVKIIWQIARAVRRPQSAMRPPSFNSSFFIYMDTDMPIQSHYPLYRYSQHSKQIIQMRRLLPAICTASCSLISSKAYSFKLPNQQGPCLVLSGWIGITYYNHYLVRHTFLSSYNLLIHGIGPGSAQCTKLIS